MKRSTITTALEILEDNGRNASPELVEQMRAAFNPDVDAFELQTAVEFMQTSEKPLTEAYLWAVIDLKATTGD